MRLPYLRKAAPEVCATARAQRWDPAEVLRVLLAEEVLGRDIASKRIRTAAAGFPSGKTFDSWRPEDSDIPKPTQHSLMTLEWVGRAENVVVWGPSGAGKTHFCEGLAYAVIASGRRALWFSLESLAATVSRAKIDASVQKVIARICRAELIVIDDIGTLAVSQDAAEAFYRVIDAAYERRSLAITSNLHPSGFDTIMPKALATPAVDRLLHHAHVIPPDIGSRRLAEAAAGKGVKPLA
jgi:DNA replication protein DnaC